MAVSASPVLPRGRTDPTPAPRIWSEKKPTLIQKTRTRRDCRNIVTLVSPGSWTLSAVTAATASGDVPQGLRRNSAGTAISPSAVDVLRGRGRSRRTCGDRLGGHVRRSGWGRALLAEVSSVPSAIAVGTRPRSSPSPPLPSPHRIGVVRMLPNPHLSPYRWHALKERSYPPAATPESGRPLNDEIGRETDWQVLAETRPSALGRETHVCRPCTGDPGVVTRSPASHLGPREPRDHLANPIAYGRLCHSHRGFPPSGRPACGARIRSDSLVHSWTRSKSLSCRSQW
jgi:hypothetical protein